MDFSQQIINGFFLLVSFFSDSKFFAITATKIHGFEIDPYLPP
jgi:hypothetical protein